MVLREGPSGIESDVGCREGRKGDDGSQRKKKKQAQSIDFRCVSLEVRKCVCQ